MIKWKDEMASKERMTNYFQEKERYRLSYAEPARTLGVIR